MLKNFFKLVIFFSIYLYSNEPIKPIPLEINLDVKKVNLGKELFFDTSLSRTNTISCHSCHNLEQGGVDNLQFSFGVDGKIGNINTPTVFNSTFNFVQFWNGRAKNLKEQVHGPITNPVEMDISFEELIEKIRTTKYENKFKEIYQDGITKDNISDAIAEYEKSLITPNSPFDKYLRGDENAISNKAKNGYKLFKEQGCIACHHGVNIGGNLYSKFGTLIDIESDSKGRFEVTNNEIDKYYFKVPTLRNIELTFPYLHNGSIDNLEDTVKFMANYQLGQSLTQDEINNIVAFLLSLTGELYEVKK
ncbi:cytochrome-c peroxidase [Aliarcobacter lanthieri]|uniref:cytochrome-c peroxidase n=1 Tax=Aliarcobacter lanthieri TaxID=1355374 RepID=UPI00047A550E|nr:cytochrome-c peroxidase [Aliarcobacter lanthieri]